MKKEEQIKSLRDEADRLEAQMKTTQAYELLQSASRTAWKARELLDFPEELNEMVSAFTQAERFIALTLGHAERAASLVAAGMDSERADIGDLISDEDAAHSLATWLFDCFGRAASNQGDAAALEQAKEHCPLGVDFWLEGRHDT